jgi:AcrR family transcriptional regulator
MKKSNRSIYLVDKTHRKILNAAHSLFISRGLFETQMIDVAKAADVSRGSLYRYFLNKNDLAFAVLEQVVETHQINPEFDDFMKMRMSGIEMVAGFFRAVWLNDRFEKEYRFFAEFDAYFAGVRMTKDVIDRLRIIYPDRYKDIFLDIIRQGQQDGSIDPELDPHLIMVTLINSVRGLQHRLILRGPGLVEVDSGEQTRMIDELINYCIKGISKNTGEE